jgi:hypothetical protein
MGEWDVKLVHLDACEVIARLKKFCTGRGGIVSKALGKAEGVKSQ